MSKTSKKQERIIGTIDDTPIVLDHTKSPDQVAEDFARQVFAPFEQALEQLNKSNK